MVYSPSQLDAAGDVDPVAEADVYLAYGRDLQAEEILKEAMRTTPQRVAIHSKLLEIYSKRRDAKAFELVATEAYSLTHGEGPEWEHICELGQELDASNPLYRPGGQPAAGAAARRGGAALRLRRRCTASRDSPTQPLPASAAAASDLDLDLDFSLGDDEPAAPVARRAAPSLHPIGTVPRLRRARCPAWTWTSAVGPLRGTSPTAPRCRRPPRALDLRYGAELRYARPGAARPSAARAAPRRAADPGMIEFDLGALSLDLDAGSAAAAAGDAGHPPPARSDAARSDGQHRGRTAEHRRLRDSDSGDDPLATKLALAEEFNAIGDPDGARSLAQEVLAEASGDLKSRAQRLLAEIS